MSEGPASRRATEGAFVVQFLPEPAGDGAAFYGRVERIASGESSRFRSAEELVAFMARTLGIAAPDTSATQRQPASRRDDDKGSSTQ